MKGSWFLFIELVRSHVMFRYKRAWRANNGCEITES